MIPILWRYLLQSYFKVFFLSVCTFVSVLIVSRFKEIARFAALSGDWLEVGLFTLYQIPFILPLAIPISALLAALLLFQRLSRTYELAALRTSGMSFRFLLSPLLLAAVLLSLVHFSIYAGIAPYCGREAKAILYRETSANPLLLLQRQSLVKIKHAYLNMTVKKEGKIANDVMLITHNESNGRLSLFAASQLRISGEKLLGSNIAILSHLHSEIEESFDPLLIENQTHMSTAAPVLSTALKKNRPRVDPNGLSLKMLRIRALGPGKQALAARVEILRRFSLSLAVFTFTLLGCAFGMQESRTPSKKGLFIAFLLAVAVLMSYLGLKELKRHPALALIAAFSPHLLIAFLSVYRLMALSRGKR